MGERLSAPLDEFKARELEIIELMASGLSNQEIADQLYITKETVRWYNKQIYSKLGTSRRTEAIALAREFNLIVGTVDEDTATHTTQQQLPITTGPFIGRDDELTELNTLLDNPDIRLLSIIAAGGMGKSRLSLELGHAIQANYTHGAAFIDLTPVRNPDDIAAFALASLGLIVSGQQTPRDTLLNYCREKNLLLIFDNFEHVLAGASLLADILEHAPHVTLIASSRERLGLRVETAFYLQPINASGERLFLEVAAMMHPHVTITEPERADVPRLVEAVGGLPLGLILAATWVDMLSVAEIADEINANLDFLQAEMVDMPARQRSIHAVIDPTWKRLSEDEQRAFMVASVFRGGFTRELFQQVTGASLRTLQALLSRSLLSHGYARRYDMHPLLRQYAREKLEAQQTLEVAKLAHLRAFADFATHHAERLYGGHYLESLDTLEREADNIRAALDWSLAGNNIQQGVTLILANCDFWLTRSKVLEALTYVEAAIQQFEHPKLYYWHAVYLDRLGDTDRAKESVQRLIEYGEAKQDVLHLGYGQLRLAHFLPTSAEAKAMAEIALANAIKAGDQHLIAECHILVGLTVSGEVSTQSDFNDHYQRALEISEALGDLWSISRITNNMAIQYRDFNRQQEAKELMEYSLQLKRKIKDRAGEARRLTTLSLWAIEEEELELAQQWLAESRQVCEELGEQDRLSFALTAEGLLHLILTDFEQAQSSFEYSLAVHIAIKDYRGIVDIYGFLCLLYLRQKRLTDAQISIQKSLEIIDTKDTVNPSILIIAYAHYLWHRRERRFCVPIAAALVQQKLNTYSGSGAIVDNYFLQPLVYRIHQHIGEDAWQQAITATSGMTLKQIVNDIVNHFNQMDKTSEE